jgi:hypothetical protein
MVGIILFFQEFRGMLIYNEFIRVSRIIPGMLPNKGNCHDLEEKKKFVDGMTLSIVKRHTVGLDCFI